MNARHEETVKSCDGYISISECGKNMPLNIGTCVYINEVYQESIHEFYGRVVEVQI